MKFLHLSDVHVGAKLNWLGQKSGEYRNIILSTLEAAVNLAIEKHIDLFIISGDLFDSSFPSSASVGIVKNFLNKLSSHNIRTIVIPGNHDRLETGSVFSTRLKSEGNVFVASELKEIVITIEGKKYLVVVNPILQQFSNESPLLPCISKKQEIEKGIDFDGSIAVVHGSYVINDKATTNFPITREEIEQSGFDYIALGDWHGFLDISAGQSRAYYPGSLEPLAGDQSKAGNVIYGDFEGGLTVEPVKVGRINVENKALDISDLEQNNINEHIINEFIASANPNTVFRATISGFREPEVVLDIQKIEEVLGPSFYNILLKDETKAKFDQKFFEKFGEDLIVGRFVNVVKSETAEAEDPLEAKLLEDVLQEGVSRLLQTKP